MADTDYKKLASNGKRWCYDCEHYFQSYFCGYNSCNCNIYGSLDQDQRERHPDVTADTCKDYKSNGKAPWYEKYCK